MLRAKLDTARFYRTSNPALSGFTGKSLRLSSCRAVENLAQYRTQSVSRRSPNLGSIVTLKFATHNRYRLRVHYPIGLLGSFKTLQNLVTLSFVKTLYRWE